jgi:hypothetical protein
MLLSSVLACQSTETYVEGSLTSFSDSEIEGIWQAQYDFHEGVETLILNKDKTYLQAYEDTKGFLYSGTGNWETETDLSGRVYVHLLGGLWFPLGPKDALLKGMDPQFPGEPHYFFDHQTNKGIPMPNALILEVIPRGNSKGFVLFHFAYDIDSAPEHFEPAIK